MASSLRKSHRSPQNHSISRSGMTQSKRFFNLKIFLAFAAIYLIWGSTFLAIRFAIESIPPFFMMGSRAVTAGGALYLWARLRTGDRPRPGHWLNAIVFGSLLFTAGHGALAWGEQVVPSGIAALISATTPIWVASLQSFGRSARRLSVRVIFGLVVGLAGIAILVEPSSALKGIPVNPIGAVVLVFGSLFWAMGSVYAKSAGFPKSPLMTAGMNLLCGGVGLLGLSYIGGESPDWAAISMRSQISLAYLILFGSIIGFTAYFWLLRVVSITKVSTHSFVNPVLAVFFGFFVAGEDLNPRIIVALILMVIGVASILIEHRTGHQRIRIGHRKIRRNIFPCRLESLANQRTERRNL